MRAEPAIWLSAATYPGTTMLFSIFGPAVTTVRAEGNGLRFAVGTKSARINADRWPGPSAASTEYANQLAEQWAA